MEPIIISTPTIRSNGSNTFFTSRLDVTFQNQDDKDFFLRTVSDLGIEDSARQQLYLLEAMSFAGVSYQIY